MAFSQVFGPKTLLSFLILLFLVSILQYKSWLLFINPVATTPVQSIIISCLNHCNCLVIGLHASAIVALVSFPSFKNLSHIISHSFAYEPSKGHWSELKSWSSQWSYMTSLFLFLKHTKNVSTSGHLHVLWFLPGSCPQISAQMSSWPLYSISLIWCAS